MTILFPVTSVTPGAAQTPPTPPRPPLLFAVFGDNRPGSGVAASPAFVRLAQDMAAQQPDFVVGLGDYVLGSSDMARLQQQWAAFFAAMSPLQHPRPTRVALAPGNHDILGSSANLRLFTRYFRRAYFSFNQGDCHFIVLNTCEPEAEHVIKGAQWDWLCADLERHKAAPLIFVALHDPLFPVANHRGDSLDMHPARRDALHALFVRYRVSCVFSGHEHVYHHQQRDGVDYIISGGGGSPLVSSREARGFFHYLLVTAGGGGFVVRVRQVGR